MVGRKGGLMRFHRISPCPRCGGKVKSKWEWVVRPFAHSYWSLIFQCAYCRQRFCMFRDIAPYKGNCYLDAIRRWNAMCNGDKRYRLIYESLGGRR